MPENVKEVEVKLDEKEEKEVEVEKNPLEKLQEETNAEPITEEPAKEEVIKEEKKVEVPKYSSEMPYSEKVRKRIAKEVGKRADAERKALEWEEKFNTLENKARSGLKTGFKNNYENVSKQMKSAIDEGNTEEQVKLMEKMADIRSEMHKLDDADVSKEKPEKKGETKPLPPLAKEWASKNAGWFNKPGHTKATSLVYGIDGELTEEGWDVHDPGYYEEIDKRLKATLPGFFDKKAVQDEKSSVQSKTTRVQSPVASVSRTKSGKSNRVKLTQDDLDTAKSFGIDINDETALKRFAREVKNLSDTGQQ
tara:strand:- start:358 stop:1281 length:924 start_codon:yes stop_codon:yes gene_type:complete